VRHDDRHAASSGLHGFDHVQDEGVVAFGARRQATTETAELVGVGPLESPLFQAERRVGHHNVEVLEAGGTVKQLGVADGVAPLDAVVVFAMQEHVHLGQGPGAANGLLPVERVLARAGVLTDQATALHQQRARTTGGVAYLVALLRRHQGSNGREGVVVPVLLGDPLERRLKYGTGCGGDLLGIGGSHGGFLG
jgi:hypothetical protein